MRKLNFLLIGLLIITFCSCEKNESNGDREPQKPILPVTLGNSWTYNNIVAIYNDVSTSQNKLQYFYTIDDIQGLSFSKYVEGEPITLLQNNADGDVVEYLFNNGELVHSTILYKKNVKKGDTWVYKAAVFTDDDYSKYEIEERVITCIDTDILISTPAGDFQCMAFSYHPGEAQENGDPNHTMIHYLSENVGIIKMLHYEHDKGITTLFREQILLDYSLN